MGESYTHVCLVKEIISWVERYDPQAVIFADSCLFESCETPPKIGNHIPDVFARTNALSGAVIGEAKTRSDLENDHTMSQFRAYLSYCRNNPNTRLVLAVPWEMRSFVPNLFIRLKTEMELTTVPIEIVPR